MWHTIIIIVSAIVTLLYYSCMTTSRKLINFAAVSYDTNALMLFPVLPVSDDTYKGVTVN